jgi:hypothetical protein
MAKMNISMDDWVMREIVLPSSAGNRSARIQELIIKGFMHEKAQNTQNSHQDGLYGVLSPELSLSLLAALGAS